MEKTAHKIEEKERTSDVRLSDKIPFSKMLLSPGVRNGLHRAGYVYPTVLQANTIPIGKAGIDLIVQSKSGTGKTLIFTVILLEETNGNDGPHPQTLILAPTREIAVQIENTVNVIGSCCPGFKAVSVIGGLDVNADRKKIQNARAIVGTPGRVLHLIQNEVLNTSKVKLLVLDEADKMMSSTFRGDFDKIYNSLPSKKQMIACSATFCNELDNTLATYMRNPFLISTEKRATSLLGIKQLVYDIPEEKTNILEMQAKIAALKQIFSNVSFKQCLVFLNSQSRAESFCSFLNKDGWPCDEISGVKDQQTRLEIFKKFREFKTRILIATDLMSRGIDSANVNLVINLELPDDGATYLHRIGRAGRFGSHGIAVTFVASKKDQLKLKKLLDGIGFGLEILKFPKTKIFDLWNFSNPEEEKLYLGVYDMNGVADCEKENISNNCQSELQTTAANDQKPCAKQHCSQSDIKTEMLKHLIDPKSTAKSGSNRNGNLFSDFMDESNFHNSIKRIEIRKSDPKTLALHENIGGIANRPSVSSEKSIEIEPPVDDKVLLSSLTSDQTDLSNKEVDCNLFDNFAHDCKESPEATSNERNELADTEIKTEKEKKSVYNQAATKISPSTERGNMDGMEDLRSKTISCDFKDSVRPLMFEMKPSFKSEDIFDDFHSLQANVCSGETPSTCSENRPEDPKPKQDFLDSNPTNSIIIANGGIEKSSKEAIQKTIRKVHESIISPCESLAQPSSLNSFSEPQPSTSLQVICSASDVSEISNYPNSSVPTSVRQTREVIFDLSHLIEETTASYLPDFSISENIGNGETRRPSPKKQNQSPSLSDFSLPSIGSSNPSIRSSLPSIGSSFSSDSATETASENNETSGFNEEISAVSSGVATSSSSSYEDRSTSEDSTSEFTDKSSPESDPESSVELDENAARLNRTPKRKARTPVNQNENNSSVYQNTFTNWTNLYWNQVSQIQDYVEFYKYARQHAARYS